LAFASNETQPSFEACESQETLRWRRGRDRCGRGEDRDDEDGIAAANPGRRAGREVEVCNMKKPPRKFGHWGRSEMTKHLELAIIVLAGLLALKLMGRYF
jgi:hypothetical protein